MQLEISLNSSVLKELLKTQLKKYKQIEDIIIFGSAVKGKKNPKDIDIALVMTTKDYAVAKQFYNDLSQLKLPIHTTVVLWNEIYTEPIWKSLLSEGFSIKEDKFIKNVIQMKPVEIFSYKINKMNPSEKTQFNRKFNGMVESTNSNKIGAGSVMVPEDKTGLFKEFFNGWKNKAENKSFRALLI